MIQPAGGTFTFLLADIEGAPGIEGGGRRALRAESWGAGGPAR